MAAPVLTRRLIIQLGDGATPTELFAFPCGANKWTFKMTNNTGEVEVMDCDTPLDSPTIINRFLTSQDTSLTFAGQLARTVLPVYRAWADAGSVRNVRARIDETGANSGGYWQFPSILQDLEFEKETSGIVMISASIVATGPRAWTAAA